MSMKNPNDNIWKRTRDIPICSTAPQTNVPPRSPKRTPPGINVRTQGWTNPFVSLPTWQVKKKIISDQWKYPSVYSFKFSPAFLFCFSTEARNCKPTLVPTLWVESCLAKWDLCRPLQTNTSTYIVSRKLSGKWDLCRPATLSQHLFTPVNKVKTFYVDKSPIFIHKRASDRISSPQAHVPEVRQSSCRTQMQKVLNKQSTLFQAPHILSLAAG